MSLNLNIRNGSGLAIREKAALSGPTNLDPTFLKSFSQLIKSDDQRILQVKKFPYTNQTWVYACCQAITRDISGLHTIFQKKISEERIEKPHLERIFNNPNNMQSRTQFIESILLNLLLPSLVSPGGQCFIVPAKANGDKVNLLTGGTPDMLFPMSDNVIKPWKDEAKNNFLGWKLVVNGVTTMHFLPEEIIRIYLVNPYNPLLGVSPMMAPFFTILTDTKAARLSEQFMENGANIGGVLTTKMRLTDDQAQKLHDKWKYSYSGPQNSGETAVLHSGLEYDNISKSLSDLSFIEQREMAREEIMAAYGVSKFILGLTDDINRATAREERRRFWQDTLIPHIDRIWEAFNNQWICFDGARDTEGDFDLSRVPALKEDLTEKIKNAKELIDQGVTAAAAYKTLEIPINVDEHPWLEEPWVKGQRVNLDTGEVIGKPEVAQPGQSEPPPKQVGHNHAITKNTEQKDAYWKKWVKNTLDIPERFMKKNLRKFFVQQRNRFMDMVDEWLNSIPVEDRSKEVTKADPGIFNIMNFFISKQEQDKLVREATEKPYEQTLELQAEQLTDDLGSLIVVDINDPDTAKILTDRWRYLETVNTTSFKNLGVKLTDLLEIDIKEGKTFVQIAADIKELEKDFFQIRISNANDIARTETASVANTYRVKVFKEEEVEKHDWVTAGDSSVRDSHILEGDSAPVNIGEPFPVTGLTHPGQNEGPAKEIINCRCTTIPVV